MDLTAPAPEVLDAAHDIGRTILDAEAVVAVGGRTLWGVGGEPGAGVEVRAPVGAVRHEPADLTVTVPAGVQVAELTAALTRHGQECPLDPRHDGATVGGVLAAGLSGSRRLRYGPVRDRVLEVRFVTGDGRLVKAGGPTVKNVSGYDLPRLVVGSLGTLGVFVQATLRCQPIARASRWITGSADPFRLRRALHRPSCLAWDGRTVWCLLEGHPADVDADTVAAAGLDPGDAPAWPGGGWRGRVSVRPARVAALAPRLDDIDGLRWLAEVGVGTVHVGADGPVPIEQARRAAAELGGWMLREAGEGVDPFGTPLPNRALLRRLKEALDPAGKLSPGRLPL